MKREDGEEVVGGDREELGGDEGGELKEQIQEEDMEEKEES